MVHHHLMHGHGAVVAHEDLTRHGLADLGDSRSDPLRAHDRLDLAGPNVGRPRQTLRRKRLLRRWTRGVMEPQEFARPLILSRIKVRGGRAAAAEVNPDSQAAEQVGEASAPYRGRPDNLS